MAVLVYAATFKEAPNSVVPVEFSSLEKGGMDPFPTSSFIYCVEDINTPIFIDGLAPTARAYAVTASPYSSVNRCNVTNDVTYKDEVVAGDGTGWLEPSAGAYGYHFSFSGCPCVGMIGYTEG